MDKSAESLKQCHTYAKPPVEAETPSTSPQKKSSRRELRSEPSNAVLLAAIKKPPESQHSFREKLEFIEKSIEYTYNFKSIQTLFTSVQAVEKKVEELASRVDPLEL